MVERSGQVLRLDFDVIQDTERVLGIQVGGVDGLLHRMKVHGGTALENHNNDPDS